MVKSGKMKTFDELKKEFEDSQINDSKNTLPIGVDLGLSTKEIKDLRCWLENNKSLEEIKKDEEEAKTNARNSGNKFAFGAFTVYGLSLALLTSYLNMDYIRASNMAFLPEVLAFSVFAVPVIVYFLTYRSEMKAFRTEREELRNYNPAIRERCENDKKINEKTKVK